MLYSGLVCVTYFFYISWLGCKWAYIFWTLHFVQNIYVLQTISVSYVQKMVCPFLYYIAISILHTYLTHKMNSFSLDEFWIQISQTFNFTFTFFLINMYIYMIERVCSMAIFLTHNVNLELNWWIGPPTELLRYLHMLLLFDYNGNPKI